MKSNSPKQIKDTPPHHLRTRKEKIANTSWQIHVVSVNFYICLIFLYLKVVFHRINSVGPNYETKVTKRSVRFVLLFI